MKHLIKQLIYDFQESPPPALKDRDIRIPDIRGKANTFIGMRRTGKTSLCRNHIKDLLDKGLPANRLLYLNFEDDRLLEFQVRDFQIILDVFYAINPDNKNHICYFFFDEIQIIDKWESFIRRLLDTENVRVFITGSSSKMLSKEIATGLRGRSLTTEVFPLNFKEFLTFNNTQYNIPTTFGARNSAFLRKSVEDYLKTGGFPEVQFCEKHDRIEILQGYIESVVFKDVIERHGISNVKVLKFLSKHIMNSPGGLFSVTKFHNTLKSMGFKCSRDSLYGFIDHLEDAFLFFRVPVHSRSEKSRTTKPNKIYTIDTGLLCAMTFRNSSDNGMLLENMVFMHLRRQGYEIEYIRTSKGHETDFFARHKLTGDVQLIQVCWDMSHKKTVKREIRGLKEAMAEFSINKGTIITWDDEQEIDDRIKVIPAWKWMVL